MADESKDPKKGSITEEDAAALLQRYSAEAVLTLLQEVEKAAGEKMDWDELVKNTATGISCAREYQTLWRHLAYGKTLEDQYASDAKPSDDDSDLEHEMEASPAVSPEASAVAAAYVKVLIASGSNDSHLPHASTIDAPLTINIPSTKTSTAASDSSLLANAIQGENVIIPVSIQKLTGGLTPKKKRRDWSGEEDMKLTAALQKYGELDWDTISKEDFENGRSASELSKRWTSLTEKLGHSNMGSSSQLSETELAAVHGAMPMGDTLNVASQINTGPTEAQKIQGLSAKPEVQAVQPNPVGAAGVLSVSPEKTNSTASNPSVEFTTSAEGAADSTSGSGIKDPSVEFTTSAEGAADSTSGSGLKDLERNDRICYWSDSSISASVERVPHNQSSQSEERGDQASASSMGPRNQTLDDHVPMQWSEDEESGDADVEVASSNSIETSEDDEDK